MKMSIDPKQITLIHLAVSQLGLHDEAYRAILWGRYGAESCKNLGYAQAHDLIEHFKKMGFQVQRKYHSKDRGFYRRERVRKGKLPYNVTVLPSIDQIEMIETLAGKVTWRYEDGYQRWLTKYMKISRITTAEQASNTIEGLKKLLERQGVLV